MVGKFWLGLYIRYLNVQDFLQANNCTILNNDGKFLEIDEQNRDKFNYSDVADQNITTRLEFWRRYLLDTEGGPVIFVIVMVRIVLQNIFYLILKKMNVFFYFLEKPLCGIHVSS